MAFHLTEKGELKLGRVVANSEIGSGFLPKMFV